MYCGEEEKEEDRDVIIDIISFSRPKRTRGREILSCFRTCQLRQVLLLRFTLPESSTVFFSPISRTVDTNDLHTALPHRN